MLDAMIEVTPLGILALFFCISGVVLTFYSVFVRNVELIKRRRDVSVSESKNE